MKKILITGKNSYIGTSLEKWLLHEPKKYAVDTVDMEKKTWKKKDFSLYDTVFHVAGIAHVSADPKLKELYFRVNRDLAIETAEKAKKDGVKQFIFMSSIIVYGTSNKRERVITKKTVPDPSNFYGESKLQAEKGIKPLKSDEFKVAILRPPMIYGKDSKGNYPKLAKLALHTPIFPDFDNERSMLHIDNLCEFLKIVIDNEQTGLFFPQNAEYVKTSDMVRHIAEVHGRKILLTRAFNWLIRLFISVDIVSKVFGSVVYEKTMSDCDKGNYQIRELHESIELTEQ